jgi:hypothetical protein
LGHENRSLSGDADQQKRQKPAGAPPALMKKEKNEKHNS